MKTSFIISMLILIAFISISSFVVSSHYCETSDTCRRKLTVYLYPVIPNADNYYRKLEKDFEHLNEKIDLIINIDPINYYVEKDGIINQEADVYEIDCIFLKDFISRGKIQPLPANFSIPKDILPAGNLVYQQKRLYGAPHWLCGNFLFYRRDDAQISNVKILKDLEKIIGVDPVIAKGLLIDLKGRLTLGEMYIDGLLDEYQTDSLGKKYFKLRHTDNVVLENLKRLLPLTYSDWGRDEQYHNNKIAFYPRQFAKGNGRALVGYSESLYYLLYEANNSCSKSDTCLETSQIGIKEWPLSDKGSTPVGWVDALSISSKLSGQKLEDALTFITYCIGDSAYHHALVPDEGDVPRYLLPAYDHYYTDKNILDKAPLYSLLHPLATRLISFTEDSIFYSLRGIGKNIDTLIEKTH